jgi:flagellar biosynthesis/type III secretory pathway chaperone
MNDPAVIELVDVINDEIRLFGDLLTQLQEEQRAIVENDVPVLEASVMAQQGTAREVHLLEARRSQVVQQLSERLHHTPEDVSLSRLIELLEGEGGEELARMRSALLVLSDKVRHVTASNAFLIRQSMRYTDRCLDILTGKSPAKGMYGQFGGARHGVSSRSLLNQTA